MIVSHLDQLASQARLTPAMQQAIAFLTDLQTAPEDGRVDIDGDRVYALVQSYETKTGSQVMFEGHRRYIDLQFVYEGEEMLGWAPADLAEVTRPYDQERDMWLGSVPDGAWTPVRLSAGDIAVLYPTDAHAPMRAVGTSSPVKKLVVKVAIEG